MNKLLILTAALLSFSFAFAQQPERKGTPPPPWRTAQERKQSMLHELHLSDSQKEQLKKEQEKALDKILTPEQKKQRKDFLDKLAARKDSAQKRQAQHLQKALHLSDEQTTKLMAQQNKLQESMKQFKKEASEQLMERREKLRSLMEEQSKNLKQILNEEQLEKYKTIMRERMQKMRQENPMRNRLQNNALEKRGRPVGPDGPPPPPRPRKTDSTESISL